MEFKLENPELDLRGKRRKNIHHETKNRHLKFAMAKIAKYLYDLRDVADRDYKRAGDYSERSAILDRIRYIDSIEQHLEYEHRKYFTICTRKNVKEIKQTIETKGKR